MNTDLIRDLAANTGLMAALAFAYSLLRTDLPRRWSALRLRGAWLGGGLFFGAVMLLAMSTPVHFAPGVALDARQPVLALAGAFLPAPAALLGGAMALAYRVHLGGAGALPGVLAMMGALAVGLLWQAQRKRFGLQRLRGLLLWLGSLGLLLGLIGAVATLALPSALRESLGAPLVAAAFSVYPPAVLLFGLLMANADRLQRREAELRAALERSELASRVFTQGSQPMLLLDPQWRVIDANPAYFAMSGFERKEVIGRNTADFGAGSAPGDREHIDAQLLSTGSWSGERWRVRKSGERYPVQLQIDAVRDDEGELRSLILLVTDLSEERRHREALRRAASFDPLTGLPNRRHWQELAQARLQQARSRGEGLAVACLDLDDFGRCNTELGREGANQLLALVAARLRAGLLPDELLGRLEGDEFALLLGGLREAEPARQRVAALQLLLPPRGTGAASLSACLGLTLSPHDTADADQLLRHAQQAAEQAKQRGPGQWQAFDPSAGQRVQARRETVQRIAQAIEAGEMRLHYQPKIRLSSSALEGAEALIRWQHPQRGLLSPAAFLGELEGTPVARQLDDWVLRDAARQLVAWQAEGFFTRVSVNMTVGSLMEMDFVARVEALLAAHPGLQPGQLELELLENETLGDPSLVAFVLEQLHLLGLRSSIDDFGTGYSSLSYLQRLPAQAIKIDQSFVRDLLRDARDRALVQAVIGMGRAFHREVVAEGVETTAHAELLLEMGCDLAQGYGIARPMPPEDLRHWARSWAAARAALPSTAAVAMRSPS